MKTVAEARHANLEALIKQYGTVQAFADKIEKGYAHISQLRNQTPHSKTGKARSVGDDLARYIEQKLDLPRGWMDVWTDPNAQAEPAISAGEFSERAASIASRLDALSGERQARAFALVDLTLRTLEAEERISSDTTKRRSRKA